MLVSRPSSPGKNDIEYHISGSHSFKQYEHGVLGWDVPKYNAAYAVSMPHQYSNCKMSDQQRL